MDTNNQKHVHKHENQISWTRQQSWWHNLPSLTMSKRDGAKVLFTKHMPIIGKRSCHAIYFVYIWTTKILENIPETNSM